MDLLSVWPASNCGLLILLGCCSYLLLKLLHFKTLNKNSKKIDAVKEYNVVPELKVKEDLFL